MRIAILLLGLVIFTVALISSARAYTEETGQRAPDISGWDIVHHEHVQLSDYLGQWVLLEFSAGWCAPCIRELPEVLKQAEPFRENGKLALIMVSCDSPETLPKLQQMIRRNRVNYPVLYDGGLFNSIPVLEWCGGDTMNFSIPAYYLINPQGVVVANHILGDSVGALVDFFLQTERPVVGLRSRSYMKEDGSYSLVAEVVNPSREPLNISLDLYWTKWLYDPNDPLRMGTDIEPHFVMDAGKQLLIFDELGEASYTFAFTPNADQDAFGYQFKLILPDSETVPGWDGRGIPLVSGVTQAYLPGVAFIDGSFRVLPD